MVFASSNLHADNKVIKWVDSKGATHYGDKPPMLKYQVSFSGFDSPVLGLLYLLKLS
ncbi:MAG TPA: DUF4124 domain-containing protein [Candidatus Thioglobus sp.]|nr:DUF4124 domain-containing protein [Candidatus Thioglobus sp.]